MLAAIAIPVGLGFMFATLTVSVWLAFAGVAVAFWGVVTLESTLARAVSWGWTRTGGRVCRRRNAGRGS